MSTGVTCQKRMLSLAGLLSQAKILESHVSRAGGAMCCSAPARFLPDLSVTTHDYCTTYPQSISTP